MVCFVKAVFKAVDLEFKVEAKSYSMSLALPVMIMMALFGALKIFEATVVGSLASIDWFRTKWDFSLKLKVNFDSST